MTVETPAPPVTGTLTVTISTCPPRRVSSNHSGRNWRDKRSYRHAAFEATCAELGIPAWLTSTGWRQGPYTPPDWLRPVYAAQEARHRGGWRPLPELLVLDAVIVWRSGQQRVDGLNAPHSIKSAVDGMCEAIALNDRLIRLGEVRQERAVKANTDDWLHGRTILTLRLIAA